MKILLILFCVVVTSHYCIGYPSIEDNITEDVLAGNDTSYEYSFDTTNDTFSNDTLIQHGIKAKIKGGIKSIKTKINNFKNKIGNFKDNSGFGKGGIGGGRYIGGIRNTHSGSGTTNPEVMKWVFVVIGVILVATLIGFSLYYCQTRRNRRNTISKFEQANNL